MGKLSRWSLLASTSLLALTGAVPSSPNPPAITILEDTLTSIPPNSTLASPVIPVDFTIRPSSPLDEPVLDYREVLFLTLEVLGNLALEDFNGAQNSETWRSVSRVSLDIVGPLMEVESPIPMRKYALWGIYKAAHSMVAANDFRSRIYEMFWRRTSVGFLSFNDGTENILGMGRRPALKTDPTAQKSASTISLNIVPNATSTIPQVNIPATIAFSLFGQTIGESNVFMTLFTGILKAAPYARSERVNEFFVNARTFTTLLSFKGLEDTGPDRPFFMFEHLILLLASLPDYVVQKGGGRWIEAEMSAVVDVKVVGAGLLKRQAPNDAGVTGGGGDDVVSA